MPHIDRVTLHSERFPTGEQYPFNLPPLRQTAELDLSSPVTFFVGENGAGKSTLLEAMARACAIHIWGEEEGVRLERNPYRQQLHGYLDVHWTGSPVPGSFFAAQIFRKFAQLLDEFASCDPEQLDYFGGRSLMSQSHGQSLMSFFRSRYQLTGLYLLDEPETALSPTSQLALVNLLHEMSAAGHAQFIISTHSPILMACPGARIYNFDRIPIAPIQYEDTEHYRLYKGFMNEPEAYLGVGSLPSTSCYGKS